MVVAEEWSPYWTIRPTPDGREEYGGVLYDLLLFMQQGGNSIAKKMPPKMPPNPRNIDYKKRKPRLGDFHLVRFDVRQLRQPRSIFPGKIPKRQQRIKGSKMKAMYG